MLGGIWIGESSLAGSRQINGVVERATHRVAGEVRALKNELEEKFDVTIRATSAVVPG